MRNRSILVASTLLLFALDGAAQVPHPAAGPNGLVPHPDVRSWAASAVEAALAGLQQAPSRAGAAASETFSKTVRLDKNGSVSVGNTSGDVTVTGAAGDDVSIVAIKSTSGDAGRLAQVQIEVAQHDGRLDIGVRYPQSIGMFSHRDVRVDFTVTVPRWAAVQAQSVSGNVRVAQVDGAARAESVSGDVSIAAAPRLELAKSVSGDLDLNGTTQTKVRATSVSGDVRANGLRVPSLDVDTVSGDIVLTDSVCERLTAQSISGDLNFTGALTPGGRYDINTHSGRVRLALASDTGFELAARTFSGSFHSDLPIAAGGSQGGTMGHGAGDRSVNATFGNGSAGLTIRTFSGDIEIAKR